MRSTTFGPLFAASSLVDGTSAPAEVSAPAKPATAKSALWTRLYANLIEARQAQADAIVARHMAHHDDASLKAIGWTNAEITALRERHSKTGR